MKKRLIIFSLMITCTLVSCFDSEPKHRSAFIKFMQINILPSKGFPMISSEDANRHFGVYAHDYYLIQGYHETLDQMKENMNGYMQSLNDLSIFSELVDLDQIGKIKQLIALLKTDKMNLVTLMTTMYEQKSQLSQPDDLKIVFNQVFEKIISSKQVLQLGVYDGMLDILSNLMEIQDFLRQNHASYTLFDKNSFRFKNETLLNQFNIHIQKINQSRTDLNILIRQL